MASKIVNRCLIKRETLDPNQYTLSLLKEGLRLNFISKQTFSTIQQQIMLILKNLIMRYTKGESTSIKIETAENILNTIYYSLDAHIIRINPPEAGLALLKSKTIETLYEKGLDRVTACVSEAKVLYHVLLKNKLDTPLEVYNTTVETSIGDFFKNYNVVFYAHDTPCSIDYPLIFDDMNVQGVFYIKNYIENLNIETQFCRFFSKEAIARTLNDYGRQLRTDYTEFPVNLFEILINNSIFSVLSGNSAASLTITKPQFEILARRLENRNASEMDCLVTIAIETLIKDLDITEPKLINYMLRYKTLFVQRLLNAVPNNSLHNIVIIHAEKKLKDERNVFWEGERMEDAAFRSVIESILTCTTADDKIKIITAAIRSLEDFTDLLKADCLFDGEYSALFGALGDMELALLGKIVFFEELRDDLMDLALVIAVKNEAEPEWQKAYITYLQDLSTNRIKSIGDLLYTISHDSFLSQ